MRFHSKLAASYGTSGLILALGLAQIVLGVVNASLWRAHPIAAWTVLAIWALAVPLAVLAYYFTCWEMDATCFRERRLWRKKEIAWPEVRSIGKLGYFAGTVSVRYGHTIEDYGTIYADPTNHDSFVETLHRFASQATFDE
jgi:hypothetical protein